MRGRLLVVAGSDSGGGAGIQADVKTATVLGAHAATAITAVTAQDTSGVRGVLAVPASFVALQMEVVLDDIGADAVKTGMLGDAAVASAVASALQGRGLPLVVDPVLRAKDGASLLDEGAVETLLGRLVPLATLLTPNAPEAARLTGKPVEDLGGMRAAGRELLARGAGAVLVKGGHVEGPRAIDLLLTPAGERAFEHERLPGSHHGTGCTLATAIASGLAQGLGLEDAVERAQAFLQEAMRRAMRLGRGSSVLDAGFPAADYAGSWVRRR